MANVNNVNVTNVFYFLHVFLRFFFKFSSQRLLHQWGTRYEWAKINTIQPFKPQAVHIMTSVTVSTIKIEKQPKSSPHIQRHLLRNCLWPKYTIALPECVSVYNKMPTFLVNRSNIVCPNTPRTNRSTLYNRQQNVPNCPQSNYMHHTSHRHFHKYQQKNQQQIIAIIFTISNNSVTSKLKNRRLDSTCLVCTNTCEKQWSNTGRIGWKINKSQISGTSSTTVVVVVVVVPDSSSRMGHLQVS